MTPADTDQVRKARQRDSNAFLELIQERKDGIYKLAYAYVPCPVEEILRDAGGRHPEVPEQGH